jgi:hypothetical protein
MMDRHAKSSNPSNRFKAYGIFGLYMRGKQTLKVMLLSLLLTVIGSPFVYAQQSSSSSYRVDEVLFGTGGEVDTQSSQYRANASTGSLGVGSTSSTNYDAEAGLLTPNEPYLEFAVSPTTVDLGVMSETTTVTGVGTFYVRSYLNSDYVVKTMSQPPTNEAGSVLNAMASLASPTVGIEEFGINLVTNTAPTTFGADPVNQPGNNFADGQAVTGYDTPNQFKYVVGDTIARAPKTVGNRANGRTDYTISYIANMAPLTPSGLYTMDHDLVVIATY